MVTNAKSKPYIGTMVTDQQDAWLRAEAKRLDRPIGWVVRAAIDQAMAAQVQRTEQAAKQW